MAIFDKHDSWPPGTLRLLATLEADQATGRDCVNWSVDALSAGFDSPALRMAAGFCTEAEPSIIDAAPLCRRAMAELQIPEMSRDDILLAFLDERASAIAQGAPDIDQELDAIHRVVVTPLGHRSDVVSWCYVSERLDPNDFSQLANHHVRAFAAEWLSQRSRTA